MSERAPAYGDPIPDGAVRVKFRRRLLAWYTKRGRKLPWRDTDDPYHILVSEIMLQQTPVSRVLPKYHEWLAKYPDLETLANAPTAEVEQTWRPLGYNDRPVRLQMIARETVARYGGALPATHEELTALPGIGRYTAGAILSFAYDTPAPILDTNVMRVIKRVFAQDAPHANGNARESKWLWRVAEELTPKRNPAQAFDFNQAIMDLGALICTARKPHCGLCPVAGVCDTARVS